MPNMPTKSLVSVAVTAVFVLFFCSAALAQANIAAANKTGNIRNDSITVYVFLSEDCPICQNQTIGFRELYERFHTLGITFVGLFPNPASSEASVAAFKKKYKLAFELRRDEAQANARRLSAVVTPQVFVVRNANGKILYSGMTDNSYLRIGKRRGVTTEFYLRDALANITTAKPVERVETKPVGCFIVAN